VIRRQARQRLPRGYRPWARGPVPRSSARPAARPSSFCGSDMTWLSVPGAADRPATRTVLSRGHPAAWAASAHFCARRLLRFPRAGRMRLS